MKKPILFITLFLYCVQAFCQSDLSVLNSFKYADVPDLVYQTAQNDALGICKTVRNSLAAKGFITLDQNDKLWPAEALANPCLIGHWFISHSGSVFNAAKVDIMVKNCKNVIVYQTSASSGKYVNDFDKNAVIAMGKAVKTMESLNYVFDENLAPTLDYPAVELTSENEQSLISYFNANKVSALEGIYKSYENTTYYKIGIKRFGNKYKAIILESAAKQWKAGEVKSYFEASSVSSIYSVKWFLSNKQPVETFATIEDGGILSIELQNTNGQKSYSKFIKMSTKVDGSQN